MTSKKDTYQAWLHIDAAFGAFYHFHPDFAHIPLNLSLADSICSDAHKALNTPYDAGLFFCKSSELLTAVYGSGANPPAYLKSPPPPKIQPTDELGKLRLFSASLPSPISTGIENSRRFRALPLFASLLSLGKEGYSELFIRQVDFARAVSAWLDASEDWEVLLPPESKVMNIVLFTTSATCRNEELRGNEGAQKALQAIKDSGRIYCSGTVWRGRSAIRLAVSNVSCLRTYVRTC
jgi:glutamate/tyrosine decarboxylase-like PLP-dependent enzyme